jgi:hypothetical protein
MLPFILHTIFGVENNSRVCNEQRSILYEQHTKSETTYRALPRIAKSVCSRSIRYFLSTKELLVFVHVILERELPPNCLNILPDIALIHRIITGFLRWFLVPTIFQSLQYLVIWCDLPNRVVWKCNLLRL